MKERLIDAFNRFFGGGRELNASEALVLLLVLLGFQFLMVWIFLGNPKKDEEPEDEAEENEYK